MKITMDEGEEIFQRYQARELLSRDDQEKLSLHLRYRKPSPCPYCSERFSAYAGSADGVAAGYGKTVYHCPKCGEPVRREVAVFAVNPDVWVKLEEVK